MSFSTGSITDPSNSTKNLMDQIQPIIDQHPAWQFLEQVPGTALANVPAGSSLPARTAYRTDMYKCLGSLNSSGKDFYVGIVRQSDIAAFGMIIGETYDSTTKKMGKIAPFIPSAGNVGSATPAAAGVQPATDYSYATERHVANETSLSLNGTTVMQNNVGFLYASSNMPGISQYQLGYTVTSGNLWYLSITNDRIILSVGPDCLYTGLFDSFYDTTLDPFPLVTCHMRPVNPSTGAVGGSGFQVASSGAFTREIGPNVSAIPMAFGAYCDGAWMSLPSSATATQTRDPINGQWWSTRLRLGTPARRAGQRGLFKADVLSIPIGDTTPGVGDTITIDGNQYMMVMAPVGGSSYLHGVWVSTAA